MCICDGAKTSYTHKICTALMSGLQMFDMVDKGYVVKSKDGIMTGNALSAIKIFKKISNENLIALNDSIIEAITKIGKQ